MPERLIMEILQNIKQVCFSVFKKKHVYEPFIKWALILLFGKYLLCIAFGFFILLIVVLFITSPKTTNNFGFLSINWNAITTSRQICGTIWATPNVDFTHAKTTLIQNS